MSGPLPADAAASRFAPAALVELARGLLKIGGAGEGEALVVAESLVESNLLGHDSHGLVRLPWYLEQLTSGELVAGAPLVRLRELPSLLVCDAGRGFGQVQAHRLIAALVEKARGAGLACGTARDCGHVGRLGEFTQRAAQQGLAALATVNDNGVWRVVAPPGGVEPRISTNPFSIGVPTPDGPLVLDASTSAVAHGKVLVRRLAGEPCPPGWLQDAEGNPTCNPEVLRADPPGTLLPLGGPQGYKGFGLGMMLDILVGGLSGGFCPPPRPGAWLTNNLLVVVWNPECFAGSGHFLEQAGGLVASIRATRLRGGTERIVLPGDTSAAIRTRRLAEGIPLEPGIWDKLVRLAADGSIPLPAAL